MSIQPVRGDVPPCPICSGRMNVVFERVNQIVAVCVDCRSGLTVPASAWDVERLKRLGKWADR